MSEEKAKVYSYHTFVLPFVWESSGLTMKEFVKIFESNPNWQDANLNDEFNMPDLSQRHDGMSELMFYKEYQYFHPYVRRAIYGTEPSLVRNFSFMPVSLNNKGRYYIEKTKHVGDENVTRRYMLSLNGIKLKIFNTGIALFIVECENLGVDADGISQANIEDVKNINDYGRRISLPFIPVPYKTASSCADKLTVEIPGVAKFEDDYGAFIQDIIDGKIKLKDALSLTHMCDWIKGILGYGSSYRFTSKKTKESSSIYIYPALDDRMFVACCVCEDEETVNAIKAEKDGEYAFITDDDLSKSLYELAFVDPGMYEGEKDRNCTCVSRKMRTKLLQDHVYDRWILPGNPTNEDQINYGTIFTVANQGLMLIMNSEQYHIIESFLTQYVQMCCLVLVQRATLIHFQRETASLSSHIEEPGKSLDKRTITKLMNLQERFVAYQSQLSFNEVTPQEQGIEIYNLLRKFMFIDEETESLNERLDILEGASDTNLDFGFNKVALFFTILSGISLALQLMFGEGEAATGFWHEKPFFNPFTLVAIVLIILTVIILTVVFMRYRRRK